MCRVSVVIRTLTAAQERKVELKRELVELDLLTLLPFLSLSLVFSEPYVCFILTTFVSLRPVFGLIMACGCLECVRVEMTSVLPLILHSLGHLCLPSPESGF